MTKLLKKISIAAVAIIAAGMLYIPVSAADTATITISDKTAGVGDEVSVTIKAKGSSEIGVCDFFVTYDPAILEAVSGYSTGGAGTVRILDDATSYTLVFKALKPGKSVINLNSSSNVGFLVSGDQVGVSGSGSVTVSAPANYSTNCNLSTLKISPGTLTPAFSVNTTSYTTSVGADCTALVVSAAAEDSKATVKVTGSTLDPGTNTTKIIVTAESGATKVYTITTTKEGTVQAPTQAPTAVTATVNGIAYNVISDYTNHQLPAGYTATELDFKGQKITTGKGLSGLTIIYLEKADGSGEGAFYVYDTASDSFSLLNTVDQPAASYTILPITTGIEIPNGYTKSTHEINGNMVDVLILDGTEAKDCLFYGVDANGNSGWYRYNYADKTIQKYDAATDGNLVIPDSTQNNEKKWKIIAAASAGVAVILMGTTIVLAICVRKKKSNTDADHIEDDDHMVIYENHALEEDTYKPAMEKNTENSKDDDIEDEIANMEDILADDDEIVEFEASNDSVADFTNEDDENDFEFLDIEELEDKDTDK